jgi:tetratricopeptide (TPR) repeat protein
MKAMSFTLPRRSILALFALCLVPALMRADSDSPAALRALQLCEEQSDAAACWRAIHLGLSAKRASQAYTFWADSQTPLANSPEGNKLLPKALQLDPNNALANFLLGSLTPSFTYKQVDEKKRLLEKAVELRPDWEAAHVELARTLAQLGQYEAAIDQWRRLADLAPDDPSYRRTYEDSKKNLGAARARLREAEQKAQSDPKTMSGYAVEAAKWACDLPKAEEYAAKVEFKAAPSSGQRLLAEAYAACGQFQKARELYQKIIAGFEQRANSGLTYNEVLQVQDRSLQFLDLLPEECKLDLLRATFLENDNQWIMALNYIQDALRIAPTADLYARAAHANLQGYNQGNTGAVMQEVQEALKLDPHFLEKYPDLKPYAPAEKEK